MLHKVSEHCNKASEHFVHTARDGFISMRVQHDDVKLDFGQGQNDQRIYDAAAALRKQV